MGNVPTSKYCRVCSTHLTKYSNTMSNYRRVYIFGSTYFFTVNVLDRKRTDLTSPTFRQALREGIERARLTLPFKMNACVLMPDHIHCIWTLPQDEANYSARWAIIKRYVSRVCSQHDTVLNLSRRKRREFGLWQRRFWEHWIRDETYFERHVNYIYYNPVKHGYVKRVIEWPYSTFHRDVRKGIYSANWGDGINFDEGSFGE